MNMSKTIMVLFTILLSLLIVSVAGLSALGKDVGVLIQFASSVLIPSAIAFYGASKAGKAQEAAEQTVVNTNGRMTELIDNNRILSARLAEVSGEVPETEYLDVDLDVDGEADHPSQRMF